MECMGGHELDGMSKTGSSGGRRKRTDSKKYQYSKTIQRLAWIYVQLRGSVGRAPLSDAAT